MRIDAHHHFWKYIPAEYEWIGPGMETLQRDFLPVDLEQELRTHNVEGVVSVQARQSVEETAWLLEMARAHPFVHGVVGWVPLASSNAEAILERFAAEPKLKGVRHVLQGEPDPGFMARLDFNAGIRALRRFGLVYDLLIHADQLTAATALVDAHPKQVFVLDHAAKPRIANAERQPWAGQMRELARRDNVFCKVSGLVTEACWKDWKVENFQPYFDVLWDLFGPTRLMFGSDWPVCLVASPYGRWMATVETLMAAASGSERAQLFGDTATAAYRL